MPLIEVWGRPAELNIESSIFGTKHKRDDQRQAIFNARWQVVFSLVPGQARVAGARLTSTGPYNLAVR